MFNLSRLLPLCPLLIIVCIRHGWNLNGTRSCEVRRTIQTGDLIVDQQKFDEILDRRLELIRSILSRKRVEYAPDSGDRLHNFKRAADMLGCSRERALVGMLAKHLISVLDMVDSLDCDCVFPSVELIEEKIGDSINYFILLEAMMKERIDGSRTEQ